MMLWKQRIFTGSLMNHRRPESYRGIWLLQYLARPALAIPLFAHFRPPRAAFFLTTVLAAAR